MEEPARRPGRAVALTVAAVILAVAGVAIIVRATGSSAPAQVGTRADRTSALPVPSGTAGPIQVRRLTEPARTEVLTGGGARLALFTDGARTVSLTGPVRTLTEPKNTDATVRTDQWIRLAPHEWSEGQEKQAWFGDWLGRALADRSPDALAVALEYVSDAPPQTDKAGLQIAGDAEFGPLSESDPDGRAENSDFYDYLGVPWTFPEGKKEAPDPDRILSLDCSGFVRMVYGYRLGYPLRDTNTAGVGLPRRAFAMADFGPGQLLIPNQGNQAREFERLQPGDLLFFHTASAQGASVEHMGIYLGVDNSGHQRFISSRTKANGPTFGDVGGEATLDGTGYWPLRFRTARRL